MNDAQDIEDFMANTLWGEQEEDGNFLIIKGQRSVHWNFAMSDASLGIYETDEPVNFGTVWRRSGLIFGEPLQLVIREWLLEERALLDMTGLLHG